MEKSNEAGGAKPAFMMQLANRLRRASGQRAPSVTEKPQNAKFRKPHRIRCSAPIWPIASESADKFRTPGTSSLIWPTTTSGMPEASTSRRLVMSRRMIPSAPAKREAGQRSARPLVSHEKAHGPFWWAYSAMPRSSARPEAREDSMRRITLGMIVPLIFSAPGARRTLERETAWFFSRDSSPGEAGRSETLAAVALGRWRSLLDIEIPAFPKNAHPPSVDTA